jgi:hypothetical protein
MVVTLANRFSFQPHAVPKGRTFLALALIASALMLPRLLSAQIGLLDDGLTLRLAEDIKSDWRAPVEVMRISGRFTPAYWLFYLSRQAVLGSHPVWLFLSNWLVLLISAVCLCRFVRIAGGGERAAALSALLFLLSGPVIENFYTLSKSEVPQTLWLAASLPLVASGAPSERTWTWTAIRSGLLFGCVLLALLTKETSVVLIPISCSWLLLDTLLNHFQKTGTWSRTYAIYLLSSLLALVIFLWLRWYVALPALSQGYGAAYRLDWPSLLNSLQRWAVLGSRDFLYLIPLLASAGIWLREQNERVRRVVWNMGLWMAGWVAIFLPWPRVLEYHLLPFSLGACVLGGILLDGLLVWYGRQHQSWRQRSVALACLAGAVVLLGASIINNVSNAKVQLAVDAANARLLDFLSTLPRGATVFVNLPDPNEYVYEIRLQLHQLKERPDLTVSHLVASAESHPAASRSYYVTPLMTNQPVPSVRLAFWEGWTRQRPAALEGLLAPSPSHLADITEPARLLDIDVHQLACEAAERLIDNQICAFRREVVENRLFLYGWSVYQGQEP